MGVENSIVTRQFIETFKVVHHVDKDELFLTKLLSCMRQLSRFFLIL